MLKTILFAVVVASNARANQRAQGFCEVGGSVTVTSGINSTTKVQRSFPECKVSVYFKGTVTLATIYSDNANTPKSNPFYASTQGYWAWYAANGRYDVTISRPCNADTTCGGGLASPFTFADIALSDFVNVTDYGARCDGSTDDTTAIANTIASGAKVIYFPAGTCNHTGIVVYNKEGTTLQGAGSGQGGNSGTTLAYVGATDGVCLEWKSNRWSVLRDLYLSCGAAGYGIKNWADMAVASSQKNRFINLGIRGATGTPGRCMHVGWAATNPDVSQTEYDSVTLWGCPTGLYQDGTQTLLNVYRNFSVLAATTGMDFEGGDVRVEHSTFTQPVTAVDDIKIGGSALWAYIYGAYHEIYAGRPSNATAYNFPTSGVRGYPTDILNTRILWLRSSGTPIYFNQGGPFRTDSVAYDSAGSGVGVVTVGSAGSYKTSWRDTNSLYTAGMTRSVVGTTALLRDYDTIAATDPLGTGTYGGVYGTNMTALLQKLFMGVSSEADVLASVETAGTILTNNFKGYRVKDSAGSPITIASLASDNTAILGTYNSTTSNGHVIFYVKGAEVGRVTPTTNNWSLGTAIDDGASKLQVAGLIRTTAVAFASLTTCSGGIEGATRAVTDSSTAVWGATITGSGGNHVLAYCNGSNWTVYAK